MGAMVEWVNAWGEAFAASAGAMLIQSSAVIAIVLLLDLALRRWVRAVFRYWLWVLILVKLVLPPTLSAPYTAGAWLASGIDRVALLVRQSPQEPADDGEATTLTRAVEFDPVTLDPTAVEASAAPALWQAPAAFLSEAPAGQVDSARPTEVAAPEAVGGAVEDVFPESEALTVRGTLFGLWALVSTAMALLVVQRTRVIHKLMAQSIEADAALKRLLQSCRTRMRMSADVDVRISPVLSTPAVYGVFHPVILIPSQVRDQMPPEELEIIVVHELVHVRRGDLSVKLLQTILQVVYFYNPLLWLANAMIRRVREQAVDETVLVTLGAHAITEYPRALVRVAGLTFGRPGLGLRLIGVVESKGLLTERIRIMLHKPIPRSAKLSVLSVAALASLAAFLLPMARAQDKPPSGIAAEEVKADAVPSLSAPGREDAAQTAPPKLLVTRVARVLAKPDGKTATVVTAQDLEGNVLEMRVSGEGDDLQTLEAQIAELKKELDAKMEMLRLLEGKLKVAQLELRVKERASADADRAAAAGQQAIAAKDEAIAAKERAVLEPAKLVDSTRRSVNALPEPPIAVSRPAPTPSVHSSDPFAATHTGRDPRPTAATPTRSRRTALIEISDTSVPQVSPEIRQAVQEILPQVLEEMLPRVIEEVLAKMDRKSTGR